MNTDKLYFWFSREDKQLRFGDERLVKTGITHSVKGELRLYCNGLHASEKIIDALVMTTGKHLWIVSVSDEKIVDKYQVCARSRTYRAGFNATKMVELFARKQALLNVELIKPFCNPRQYASVFDWLLTGGDELRMAAWRVSNNVAISTKNSEKNLPAYVTARAIMHTTNCDVISVADSLKMLAILKGQSSPSNKDYAQANKMLMGMLPDRIKTVLAQHEQGEPV